MKKNYRYRLYPTKKQQKILSDNLEECRWLYNETLAYRKHAWEQEERQVSWYESKRRIPLLKEERLSLKTVHSTVLQDVTQRVDLALQSFFRRCKLGEEPGYPRFKGCNRYDSITYVGSGFNIMDHSQIYLSKIGKIKMIYHRSIKGRAKTCVIHRSPTKKWYATFSVEYEPELLEPTATRVGIDVGLNTFATLSTAEKIDNPRFFRKEEKALARVQRKHSKLASGSPDRQKSRKVIARVHERIKFRRMNFIHQNSRQIVNRFGIICVEDINASRMVHNHCLAKSIADASWSGFLYQLASKAEEAGRQLVKVNPAYTSQDCSRCHHRQKMPLSERTYECPCCHLSIDRDINASLNILALGLQGLGLSLEAPISK